MKEWWDGSLDGDSRWKYGKPCEGNANFAWMQHMLHHTSPNGVVGLVLSNGSLSTNTAGEKEVREAIIKADLVEAIVALPSQLFSNTQIPACIWILNKNKANKGKTLFIDARQVGYMIDRKQKAFSDNDIHELANVFHKWRKNNGYVNVAGKYYEASVEEIAKHEYILTPGRYVGAVDVEDDGVSFAEKMHELTNLLSEQFNESSKLESRIKKNLAGLGYDFFEG